ncbi:ADP-ribose glycohydrolase MACROD1 [Galemys pyrenaicus]|uniref:ADP-ribose glycohydrolase MACROD1 n=1 Tax=Galemys pyrenaicus TaxID=202257 RepID=A0A8J6DVR3_GALPY|nr:ADP-ribose glycohydrolase MACROD1 [Galemys pyrenaicus]
MGSPSLQSPSPSSLHQACRAGVRMASKGSALPGGGLARGCPHSTGVCAEVALPRGLTGVRTHLSPTRLSPTRLSPAARGHSAPPRRRQRAAKWSDLRGSPEDSAPARRRPTVPYSEAEAVSGPFPGLGCKAATQAPRWAGPAGPLLLRGAGWTLFLPSLTPLRFCSPSVDLPHGRRRSPGSTAGLVSSSWGGTDTRDLGECVWAGVSVGEAAVPAAPLIGVAWHIGTSCGLRGPPESVARLLPACLSGAGPRQEASPQTARGPDRALPALFPAVDGCIHRAAGPLLTDECRTLQSCETGKAKITGGYRLPAKYVIHTVGPIVHGEPSVGQAAELRSCYLSSLDLLLEHRLRSAAFPCISTGVFGEWGLGAEQGKMGVGPGSGRGPSGEAKLRTHSHPPAYTGYPNEAAAEVVLGSLREWLEQHKDKVDRLVICVFLEKDESIYLQRLPHYFPMGRYRECMASPAPAPAFPRHTPAGSHCPLPSSLTAPHGPPCPGLTHWGLPDLAPSSKGPEACSLVCAWPPPSLPWPRPQAPPNKDHPCCSAWCPALAGDTGGTRGGHSFR